MTQEQSTALSEIINKLEKLIHQEQDKATDLRWQRCNLYAEARQLLKGDREFGQWCKTVTSSIDANRLDAPATINKMMRIYDFLTEEQYKQLKYSRAAEFVPLWAWKPSAGKEGEESFNLFTFGMSEEEIKSTMVSMIERATHDNWSVKRCRGEMDSYKNRRQGAWNEHKNKEEERISEQDDPQSEPIVKITSQSEEVKEEVIKVTDSPSEPPEATEETEPDQPPDDKRDEAGAVLMPSEVDTLKETIRRYKVQLIEKDAEIRELKAKLKRWEDQEKALKSLITTAA